MQMFCQTNGMGTVGYPFENVKRTWLLPLTVHKNQINTNIKAKTINLLGKKPEYFCNLRVAKDFFERSQKAWAI